ncbi:MAG: 1-deoxy-D-xylulose-5-phosphate synthase, partial [Muribaculaceae bacterium]|nr:1-deoxy-D-xylulose-5-phosphate synthase [Muribaculaceae bacterium]
AIYSSFLQRGFDNIIHDVAIQGLPVVFCIDRAGLVGEDGVTHHGLYDMAYMRLIPGLCVASPMDIPSLKGLLYAANKLTSPISIRYPRGRADGAPNAAPIEITLGKGRKIVENSEANIAILSIGPVGNETIEVAHQLQKDGIAVDCFDMIWVKPLDMDILKHVAEKYDAVITVEDGTVNGGFGSAVAETLSKIGYNKKLLRLGVPDEWIYHAKVSELREKCEIDCEGIKKNVLKIISKESKK